MIANNGHDANGRGRWNHTAAGGGYGAGALVSVYLGSQLLGTVTASATGTVSATFTIPPGTAPGTYVINLSGAGPGGVTRINFTSLSITR